MFLGLKLLVALCKGDYKLGLKSWVRAQFFPKQLKHVLHCRCIQFVGLGIAGPGGSPTPPGEYTLLRRRCV
jgi:hypothetical protein